MVAVSLGVSARIAGLITDRVHHIAVQFLVGEGDGSKFWVRQLPDSNACLQILQRGYEMVDALRDAYQR